jgi:hypothetical protein
LSTKPAFNAPKSSESPFGKIQFLASAITSSTLSYPSFLTFQFVFLSFSISFELLNSFETSTRGSESSKDEASPLSIGLPSSPKTTHFGFSISFILSVLRRVSSITFLVDSFTSLKKSQIGSPTYL